MVVGLKRGKSSELLGTSLNGAVTLVEYEIRSVIKRSCVLNGTKFAVATFIPTSA